MSGKITAIKELRLAAPGLGLSEAKQIVDAVINDPVMAYAAIHGSAVEHTLTRIADALECINPPGVSDTICVAPDFEALAVLREIHECLATTSEHGDLTAIISPDLYHRIKVLTGPCDQCKHKEIS